MIGILLITHYDLGDCLIKCANHFFGEHPEQLLAVSVHKDEDPDALLVKITELIHQLNTGDGVLVFSDMYGGTPANIASRLTTVNTAVSVVTGVNLPMLIRTLNHRTDPLEQVVEKAIEGGCLGIQQIPQEAGRS